MQFDVVYWAKDKVNRVVIMSKSIGLQTNFNEVIFYKKP